MTQSWSDPTQPPPQYPPPPPGQLPTSGQPGTPYPGQQHPSGPAGAYQGPQLGYPPQQGYPPPGYPPPGQSANPPGFNPYQRPQHWQVLPLGIDKIFSATWATFKADWKRFVLIALIASLISSGVALVAALPFMNYFFAAIVSQDFDSLIMALPMWLGAISLVGYLISWVATFMLAALADAVGQGQKPSTAELFQRGLRSIQRVLLPMICIAAVNTLSFAASGVWIKSVFETIIQTRGRVSDAWAANFFVSLLLMMLLTTALSVLSIVATIRFFLAAPVAVAEPASGFAVFGRSWKVSKGASWRIFGFILIVGLIVSSVSGVVVMPMSVMMSNMTFGYQSDFSTTMIEAFSQMLPLTIVSSLVGSLVAAVSQPILTISSVVIYHDQLRVKSATNLPT